MTDTTTVRGAVAKRDEAATPEVAPAQVSPAAYARQRITKQMPRFASVLPKHLDPERFTHIAVRCVQATPDLIDCFATPQGELSFMLAALQAAAIGLEPNTPLQHCYILPRRKGKGPDQYMTAEFSMDYRGYQALARRSGEVKTIFAEVVYEGDHFRYERGLEADVLEHRPCASDQRGELTHAYGIVRYRDGGYNFVVLDRGEIENDHRAKSDSWRNEKSRPYSPWTTAPAAMWRKTAIRQLAKWMPLTSDVAAALDSDGADLTLLDGDVPEIVAQHVDAIDVGEATITEAS